MTSDFILEVKDLTKSYGAVTALDGLSFTLGRGEILGLLGPNGAGKTTLISILSGTLQGFSGSVTFQGKNLFADRRLKKRMGIVPQEMAFYEELNARDNLHFFGTLYGLEGDERRRRAREMLDFMELGGRSREPVRNFSGGMKRRLNLAIGLLHQPELLLLDEPTVGIDVQAKVRILEIIRQSGRQGMSVIFTTHQLAEAEEICSRIAVMDKGSILAQGTLAELIGIVGEKQIVTISGRFSVPQVSRLLKKETFFDTLSVNENQLELAFIKSEKIPKLLEILIKNHIAVSDIRIAAPNLETVFLKLTGRSLRD